jgi:hypothetical protein
MKKEEAVAKIREYGDATITFRGVESGKMKYHVCTLDFDNDYIRSKPCRAVEAADTILTFSWDADAYRQIRPAQITSIKPLKDSLQERKHG